MPRNRLQGAARRNRFSPQSRGLLLRFALNEGGGTAVRNTGDLNHTGTAGSNTSWSAADALANDAFGIGPYLDFDGGTNSYVDVNNNNVPVRGDFCVCGWVNTASAGAFVMAKYASTLYDWGVYLAGGRQLGLFHGSGAFIGSTMNIPADEWCFIAVAIQVNGNSRFHMGTASGGFQTTTFGGSTSITNNINRPVCIGRREVGATNFPVVGGIADMRVYERDPGAEAVEQVFAEATRWQLDEQQPVPFSPAVLASTGPGPTFNAAWAKRSTIGAGFEHAA